jgi:type IV pilus assembly protein PilA
MKARGFTLIELVIVVSVISVLAAIAIPGLLRARISGNEASAIGSVRAIVSAQADYFSLNRGYAASLDNLATTCASLTTPFVSADLNANGTTKSGYTFVVVPGGGAVAGPTDSCGNVSNTAFYATATPIAVGVTGGRGFAADAALAIWQDTGGAPPPQPFTAGGTISVLGR